MPSAAYLPTRANSTCPKATYFAAKAQRRLGARNVQISRKNVKLGNVKQERKDSESLKVCSNFVSVSSRYKSLQPESMKRLTKFRKSRFCTFKVSLKTNIKNKLWEWSKFSNNCHSEVCEEVCKNKQLELVLLHLRQLVSRKNTINIEAGHRAYF